VVRTVIAAAAIGVGVSLIAAPVASAQPTDCSNSSTVPIGPVCTLPVIIQNYVSTPQQFAEGLAAQPGEIEQGVTNLVAFPGQVVQAWTNPFTPFATTSTTTAGTNIKKK
jgi:hypothetical protein